MKKNPSILCCPSCKRVLQAKDFLANPAVVGLLDSVLQTFECACGYRGLPIEMTMDDYERWRKSEG